MFNEIDKFNFTSRSGQAKRQTKTRKKESLSTRTKPTADKGTEWAFNQYTKYFIILSCYVCMHSPFFLSHQIFNQWDKIIYIKFSIIIFTFIHMTCMRLECVSINHLSNQLLGTCYMTQWGHVTSCVHLLKFCPVLHELSAWHAQIPEGMKSDTMSCDYCQDTRFHVWGNE